MMRVALLLVMVVVSLAGPQFGQLNQAGLPCQKFTKVGNRYVCSEGIDQTFPGQFPGPGGGGGGQFPGPGGGGLFPGPGGGGGFPVGGEKPGICPPARPTCPTTRFGPPQPCFNDAACNGPDKCCWDTCLSEKVCKPTLGGGVG